MRCPECGAVGYSRQTKTPEWRCRKCAHEWDITSDRPTIAPSPPTNAAAHGRSGTERLTIPKGVLHFLNVILYPIIVAIIGGFVFIALSPVQTLARVFLGGVPASVFGVLISLLAIGIGLYVATKVHSDVNRRIAENDW